MELRDALDQISTIQRQLAATESLRSLRAIPVALSGLLAIATTIVQQDLVRDPTRDPARYLALWVGAAVLSGVVATFLVMRRALRGGSLGRENARVAAVQFAPSLVAGAVVTWLVATRLPHELWILPGLWQLLFGVGNLAAHRMLPAPAWAIGVLFLASGTACLTFGEGALEPWAMGLPFATGQLALAAILWWFHERNEADGRLA